MRIDNGLQLLFSTWEQALGKSAGHTGRGILTLEILVVSWRTTGKRLINPSSNTSIPFCSHWMAMLLVRRYSSSSFFPSRRDCHSAYEASDLFCLYMQDNQMNTCS